MVVGGSLGVDGADVGGAGQRRPRAGSRVLRYAGAVHAPCSPGAGEPISMEKPPTGEPYAGEPHVRFGGRGGRETFPTPIVKTRDFVGGKTLDPRLRGDDGP